MGSLLSRFPTHIVDIERPHSYTKHPHGASYSDTEALHIDIHRPDVDVDSVRFADAAHNLYTS